MNTRALQGFSAMLGQTEEDRPGSALLPEAVIAELRERLQWYIAPCPFNVGDLVTPRAGANTTGVGEPHIVVEVNNDAAPLFSAEKAGSRNNGHRLTIRVLCRDGDEHVRYWGEHGNYEPYTGPGLGE